MKCLTKQKPLDHRTMISMWWSYWTIVKGFIWRQEQTLSNQRKWHHKSYWPIKSDNTNPTWPFSGPHKDGDLWIVQTCWPELPDSLCGDICPGKSKHSFHINACKTIRAFSKLIFKNYQLLRIKTLSKQIFYLHHY